MAATWAVKVGYGCNSSTGNWDAWGRVALIEISRFCPFLSTNVPLKVESSDVDDSFQETLRFLSCRQLS